MAKENNFFGNLSPKDADTVLCNFQILEGFWKITNTVTDDDLAKMSKFVHDQFGITDSKAFSVIVSAHVRGRVKVEAGDAIDMYPIPVVMQIYADMFREADLIQRLVETDNCSVQDASDRIESVFRALHDDEIHSQLDEMDHVSGQYFVADLLKKIFD